MSLVPKLKRRTYQFILFLRPVFYLAVISLIILFFIWFIPKTKPLTKIFSLINPAITQLNSFRGRTNFLLLGIGGGDHPGADLTDSIMFISVNLTHSDTVLISLPRDIWIESLSAKINTAYEFGEAKQLGGGLVLAKSAVSEIINQPVHYAVLLDFSGFERAIDIVGGIDLNVLHGFTDPQYPVPGKETAEPESSRYEALTFSPGQQHMDGSLALKYVRSRYSQGEEGSDYARAQRQQLVLLAFKDKVLSPSVLLNPAKLKALYQEFKHAVKTDLSTSSYIDLVKLVLRVKSSSLRTGIVDQGSSSEDIPALLYNPPSSLYGQWVLLPVNNNWQSVYSYVSELLYQNKTQ
ncbi:MAG: LCP family protein [Candidatus Beckwithbacteria bacterium]|nr:LCP family protein [Candidatus Beckwithbacteria bacterium]